MCVASCALMLHCAQSLVSFDISCLPLSLLETPPACRESSSPKSLCWHPVPCSALVNRFHGKCSPSSLCWNPNPQSLISFPHFTPLYHDLQNELIPSIIVLATGVPLAPFLSNITHNYRAYIHSLQYCAEGLLLCLFPPLHTTMS